MNIIGCATVWGKCIKRVTACHIVDDVLILLMSQVPVLITDHHMCTPGQSFFSFLFNYIHPQSNAECKARETPTPGRLEGGHAPDTGRRGGGGVPVFVSACHFHLSQSNEGTHHLLSETACQSSTVEAPEMEML